MNAPSWTVGALLRAGIGERLLGAPDVLVRDVHHDSRRVAPGSLFVVSQGRRFDARRFVPEALRRGASALLLEAPIEGVDVPQLICPDPRRAMGRAAHLVHGDPSRRLPVAAVTGTNGKTSVCWLLDSALRHAGRRPALMGTVGVRGARGFRDASLTTPESDEVARFAAEALDAGASHLLMEASSHALAMGRLEGLRVAVAAFTGLGRDHLDFHGSMEAYAEAKARLFVERRPEAAVIRVDDAFGAALWARSRAKRGLRVARAAGVEAEIRVLASRFGRDGIEARVQTPWGEGSLRSPLLGEHNLDNLLVALGVGLLFGEPLETMLRGLSAAQGAPGRLERVEHPGDVTVLVDYAHTPDALERVLRALRPLTPGRLIVVFGCGGERDEGKRVPMGEAAALGADLCLLTNDNPRGEAPERIAAQVEEGLRSAGKERIVSVTRFRAASEGGYLVELDRRAALALALDTARPGDTVLVAGKGHERVQIVGAEQRPFEDRSVLAELIAARGGVA